MDFLESLGATFVDENGKPIKRKEVDGKARRAKQDTT